MRQYVLGSAAILGLGLLSVTAPGHAGSAPASSSTPVPASTAKATPAPTAVPTPVKTKTPAAHAKPTVVAEKGNTETAKAVPPPQRNPQVATILAIFPGIAIHGAGHLYAGSWMKGAALFALEGATVYLLYDAYHQYERGDFDNITKNNGSGIPTNLGIEYQEAGIALVSITGWGATWVDDMIGAHFAAKQFNQVHQQDSSTVSLRLQPRPDGAVLALSSTF
ncbi:MAG TPA: hypothetical protein VK786_04045 [bacterium]|jgi:hypothetical protein|nr:hypothetical protein [bacterium]